MRDQRGDTIVEVLIAIVVVSMVLVAAYVTTTRNVNGMQDTEEHSEALQLAQAQLEYLHNAAVAPTNGSCFLSDGSTSTTQCVVDASGTPLGPSSTEEPQFTLSISQTLTSVVVEPTFEISVTWASIDKTSTGNSVSLFYQP